MEDRTLVATYLAGWAGQASLGVLSSVVWNGSKPSIASGG